MSDTLQTLSELETRLWEEGEATYRELCSDDVVMMFADPVAKLDGLDAVLEELPEGGRWARTKMTDASVTKHGGAAVLAYRMEAGKDADNVEPFHANCVSVWHHGKNGWRQLTHAQIPADALDANA